MTVLVDRRYQRNFQLMKLSVKVATVPTCQFLVFALVHTGLRCVAHQQMHFEIRDLFMVNLLYVSARLLGSHYNYQNQLASIIKTAPCGNKPHFSKILRAGFSSPETLLAVHHFASSLFAGFVSENSVLRRQFVPD